MSRILSRSTATVSGSLWCMVIALFAFTIGCGGDNVAPVSGTISLNSKPLADAYVVFEPVEVGAAKIATGKTDADGRYSLSMKDGSAGCLVGEHKVRLTTVPPDAMDDERSPLPKDRIPKRYQESSPIFEVSEEGTDKADFDLAR